MDDWLDEEGDDEPEREREYARLASRMGSLGFSDGAEAGHAAVLQAAFDRGYREGFGNVETNAVRMASALATFAEFYARHGAALGIPVSLSALVYGDAPKLAAEDVTRRLARLLGTHDPAADADTPARWARLLGWAESADEAEFTRRQFDVAVDAVVRDGGASFARKAHASVG